jgi:hypothetical protein
MAASTVCKGNFMPGEVDLMNLVNPNGGLPIDLMANRGGTQATANPLASLSSVPEPGEAIDDSVKRLCRSFETELGKLPTWSLGGASKVLDCLGRALKGLPGSRAGRMSNVTSDSRSVCAALETHRGPVIVLTPGGRPQYVFQWKNDRWHGYNAYTFDRLPTHQQVSPAETVKKLFLDSGHGLSFSTYQVEGWKEALHASVSDGGPLFVHAEQENDGTDTATILRERIRRTSSPAQDDASSSINADSGIGPVVASSSEEGGLSGVLGFDGGRHEAS